MYIALVGFAVMLVISKMDYHFFAKFAPLAVIVSYACMILVNFTPLGIARNGKKRWLGYGSFTIQPAEMVKITVILVLAVIITKLGKQINVPQRTYAYYERGERMIPPQVLIALAQFHNVSVDYLLGLTDRKAPYPHK